MSLRKRKIRKKAYLQKIQCGEQHYLYLIYHNMVISGVFAIKKVLHPLRGKDMF